MSRDKGWATEQEAKRYLIAHGLKWIASNYSCRLGEIDLIMQEDDCLVFTEVRSRSSDLFGGAAASVTLNKQKKLLKVAHHFLMTHTQYFKSPARFDVVSFDGRNLTQINWIKNAFDQGSK